jgi:hypothetical protein
MRSPRAKIDQRAWMVRYSCAPLSMALESTEAVLAMSSCWLSGPNSASRLVSSSQSSSPAKCAATETRLRRASCAAAKSRAVSAERGMKAEAKAGGSEGRASEPVRLRQLIDGKGSMGAAWR